MDLTKQSKSFPNGSSLTVFTTSSVHSLMALSSTQPEPEPEFLEICFLAEKSLE